jgi:hypothetical protein
MSVPPMFFLTTGYDRLKINKISPTFRNNNSNLYKV